MIPKNIIFSASDREIVNNEIAKLPSEGVIEGAHHIPDSYISNVFVRPKKDNTLRMILNLKSLNKFIAHHHFKMILSKQRSNSFDLVALWHLSICEMHTILLLLLQKIENFLCLNGKAHIFSLLACLTVYPVPRLIAQTHNDCVSNIHDTVHLFTKLGFIVHPKKSILKPTQAIEFLGFIINNLTMTVRLSASKSTKVQKVCHDLLKSKHITVRDVAHVIDLLVSSLPAVQFGALYYWRLEIIKLLPSD